MNKPLFDMKTQKPELGQYVEQFMKTESGKYLVCILRLNFEKKNDKIVPRISSVSKREHEDMAYTMYLESIKKQAYKEVIDYIEGLQND